MRALQATLVVVFITLTLFFASGMYDEKIRYAHRSVADLSQLSLLGCDSADRSSHSYINHSNKMLRPLNMHLNLRRPRFPILSYIRPPKSIPTSFAPSPTPPPATLTKLPPGPARRGSIQPTVMAQIPASTNPRGELIFSSRVDKSFREGYERHRAAFERRREEKARQDAVGRSRGSFLSWRKQDKAEMGRSTPTPPASRRGTPPPGLGGSRGRTPSPGSRLRFAGRPEGEEEKGEMK